METIILLVHVLVAVGVIGLIMLQQGKGAETGASFGSGASQTVFGSQGSANFLSRTTAILATIFFVTSIGLAMMARQKADAVTNAGLPSVQVEQVVPVNDAPFSLDSVETSTESDAPVLESLPVESSSSDAPVSN
ncbi:preprotein translocase subunit SecG [uncultured Endozoicomonas sp.]|uniref:preprotein translocase subunit SecG n=1 Tax=uncultured Endozoicomonas sp. TaxID=432652 RepID=UPI002601EC51|nr:preprotein translocase subunit SecG [uncultured Endozoicomonas sp.]